MLQDKEIDAFNRKFIHIVLTKLQEAKLGELVLALTSVALVFVGVAQVMVAWKGYRDTTPLVEYARRNTEASEKFASGTESINHGISSAVTELGAQAVKMDASVTQASRLAADTEVANDNAMQADRPWFGAMESVDGFEVGKTPIATVVFQNSGRRPAKVTITESTSRWFKDFPANPPYTLDTTPSTTIVVPERDCR
jgi:hypothetical protein